MLAREFWPSSSTPAATAPAASGPAKPATRRTASGKIVPVIEPRLDPTLDLNLLSRSEEIKYAGNGRNIFVAGSVAVIERPKGNGTDKAVVADAGIRQPPPVPPPPPINLKFFGFANRPGKRRRCFCPRAKTFLSRPKATSSTGAIASCTSRPLRWMWKTCLTTTGKACL